MPKPLLWRVCGWWAVLSLVCGILLIVTGALAGGTPNDAAIAVVITLLAIPFGALWSLGTLIHRSRVHRARIQAAAYQEILPRGPVTIVSPSPNDTTPDPRKFRSGPLGL